MDYGVIQPIGAEAVIPEPTLRKPLGILMILVLIGVWVVVIASFSAQIGTLPIAAQGVIYLIAGVAWILPLGPVLKWMETGKFR